MNPPSSGPMQADETARVRCLYCGANNFPGAAECWQCKRPLRAARAEKPLPELATAPLPSPLGIPARGLPRPSSFVTDVVDPKLAGKTAALLGLMFPYVGLPVGMVFLMLDDPRKVQLGWQNIGWSLVGSVINIFALFLTLMPLLAGLKLLLPQAHPGGGVPDLSGGAGGVQIILQMGCYLWNVC